MKLMTMADYDEARERLLMRVDKLLDDESLWAPRCYYASLLDRAIHLRGYQDWYVFHQAEEEAKEQFERGIPMEAKETMLGVAPGITLKPSDPWYSRLYPKYRRIHEHLQVADKVRLVDEAFSAPMLEVAR